MKVIASSLRKGNVVELDGKLYVVLTAQNFHPGKGTPVTQVDMRRIADGVKVSERWRTTEEVERARLGEDASWSSSSSIIEAWSSSPSSFSAASVAGGGLGARVLGRLVEARRAAGEG